VSEQDFRKVEASKGTQKLLNMCLKDIFKLLELGTSLKLNDLKSKFE
jgi:hypothetical protein